MLMLQMIWTGFYGNRKPDSLLASRAVTPKQMLLPSSVTLTYTDLVFILTRLGWKVKTEWGSFAHLWNSHITKVMFSISLFISCFINDYCLFSITPLCNSPVRLWGYWTVDWQCSCGWGEEVEEEGGNMRQTWQSSICCHGYKKVHLPFSQLRWVTADYSLHLHHFSILSSSSSHSSLFFFL